MSSTANALEKRLRLAGVLLIAGLLVEAVCLLSGRPIAFVIFVCAGGLFLSAGVVIYLLALVSSGDRHA